MKKITQQAIAAKACGYTHIASIIKSVYTTNYYNVQAIDDVIDNDGWIGAVRGAGKYCRGVGVTINNFPANAVVIFKSRLNQIV